MLYTVWIYLVKLSKFIKESLWSSQTFFFSFLFWLRGLFLVHNTRSQMCCSFVWEGNDTGRERMKQKKRKKKKDGKQMDTSQDDIREQARWTAAMRANGDGRVDYKSKGRGEGGAGLSQLGTGLKIWGQTQTGPGYCDGMQECHTCYQWAACVFTKSAWKCFGSSPFGLDYKSTAPLPPHHHHHHHCLLVLRDELRLGWEGRILSWGKPRPQPQPHFLWHPQQCYK